MVTPKRVTVISGGRSATKTICRRVAEAIDVSSSVRYQFPDASVVQGDRHLSEILNFPLESAIGITDDTKEPRRALPGSRQLTHMWGEATSYGFKYVEGARAETLDHKVIHNRLLELDALADWVVKVFPRSWEHAPFELREQDYMPYIERLVRMSDCAFILRRRNDVERARSLTLLSLGYSARPTHATYVDTSTFDLTHFTEYVASENALFDRIAANFGITQVFSEDLLNDVNGSVAGALGLPALAVEYKREYPTNKEEL